MEKLELDYYYGKDTEVLDQVIKEYTANTLDKKEKASVREQLKAEKAKVKAEWILRGVFQLDEYEPLTTERLVELGINGLRFATIELKRKYKGFFSKYGIYSIKLYQYDHFLKQVEFCHVPKIKSNYSPFIVWPNKENRFKKRTYTFDRGPEWEMEFERCVVTEDEAHYTVEIPAGIGKVDGILKMISEEDNAFSCRFSFPVSPLELEVIDNNDESMASLYIMQEFINPEIGTGLEGMGFIQVMPEEIKLKDSTEIAGLHGEDLWNLIRFMQFFKEQNFQVILATPPAKMEIIGEYVDNIFMVYREGYNSFIEAYSL